MNIRALLPLVLLSSGAGGGSKGPLLPQADSASAEDSRTRGSRTRMFMAAV